MKKLNLQKSDEQQFEAMLESTLAQMSISMGIPEKRKSNVKRFGITLYRLKKIHAQDNGWQLIVRMFRACPLCITYSPGRGWIRIFDPGISWKDTTKHPLLFSERMGIAKRHYRVGKWSFRILKRTKL